MDLFNFIAKMVILYFLIVVAYRLMGKRKISELSITDIIVFLLLSNIININIASNEDTFLYMAITISFLIALQFIMTYMSPKIPHLKYMYEGLPSVIISKGRLNFREMLKRRYNLDDLLMVLHEKSIKKIEDVEYAFLDSRGNLSIFEHNKNNNNLPLPIVLDGQIQDLTLKVLHKDDKWVHKIIEHEEVELSNIFYAFYQKGKFYIIKNDS